MAQPQLLGQLPLPMHDHRPRGKAPAFGRISLLMRTSMREPIPAQEFFRAGPTATRLSASQILLNARPHAFSTLNSSTNITAEVAVN